MRWYDGAAVDRLLRFPDLIDAMADAHRRPPMTIADTILGDEQSMYFVRNAVDPGRLSGSKLITSHPDNLARGLAAVQAVCVVFDGTDGRPLAVIDGTRLTAWRTAADSALAARHLARTDADTLLVIGAGAMSAPLVRAHLVAVPALRRVLVWNRTADRGREVVEVLRAEGIAAEPTTDLAAAVGLADLVTSCTRSSEPLIRGADLRPGVHVDLVGGFTPTTREADDEAMARARIFVDRWEPAAEVGDICGPIERGVISRADVLGDLHDIVAGRVGRRADADVTIFKNAGGGHLDLIAAEAVLRADGVDIGS